MTVNGNKAKEDVEELQGVLSNASAAELLWSAVWAFSGTTPSRRARAMVQSRGLFDSAGFLAALVIAECSLSQSVSH